MMPSTIQQEETKNNKKKGKPRIKYILIKGLKKKNIKRQHIHFVQHLYFKFTPIFKSYFGLRVNFMNARLLEKEVYKRKPHVRPKGGGEEQWRSGSNTTATGWRFNEDKELKKKKEKEERKRLKFPHVHPLVPALAPGLGPGLERSRVVQMLEGRKK